MKAGKKQTNRPSDRSGPVWPHVVAAALFGAGFALASGLGEFGKVVVEDDTTYNGDLEVENTADFGLTNTIGGAASIAVGASNTVDGTKSGAVGSSNDVDGDNSAAFGTSNTVRSWADIGFAAGTSNDVQGYRSAAFGYDNTTSGNNTFAFGSNLLARSYGAFIVGQYNADPPSWSLSSWQGDTDNHAFVVGIGTSGSPANAFEVRQDGTVIINEVQGDLSMGSFTQGP